MSFTTVKEYIDSLPKEHQNIIQNFRKISLRIYRNGENVINKKGRKTVSTEHKLEVRKAYMERKKQEKIDNGTYRPRGRPKKIQIEPKK